MKKEWQQPELEVLEVTETMGHTYQIDHLDASYDDGTPYADLTWS